LKVMKKCFLYELVAIIGITLTKIKIEPFRNHVNAILLDEIYQTFSSSSNGA